MGWFSRLRELKTKSRAEDDAFREEIQKTGLERGDKFAMFLSAAAIFIPVALGLLLIFYLIGRLFLNF